MYFVTFILKKSKKSSIFTTCRKEKKEIYDKTFLKMGLTPGLFSFYKL